MFRRNREQLFSYSYRKYQRTAQTMIAGSKCRHLNKAGRGLDTAPAYQTHTPNLQHILLFRGCALWRSKLLDVLHQLVQAP